LEKASFDELIGYLNAELQGKKGSIKKIQELKALNKERVIVKHYAHLAEPATVRNFFQDSIFIINDILKQVVGRQLDEIMLLDIIAEGETKKYLKESYTFIEKKEFYEAMVAIRKAIFIEIEQEYSVEGWKDYELGTNESLLKMLLANRGGNKASYYAKNKKWIDENVRTPFEYIRLDRETIKLELLEIGANTEEYWNIWRLTPEVYRFRGTDEWAVTNKSYSTSDLESNARYCYDAAVSIVWKKQMHRESAIYHNEHVCEKTKVKAKYKTAVYQKASKNSKVEKEIDAGTILCIEYVVSKGLDGDTRFALVFSLPLNKDFTYGFIEFDACEIVQE